MPHPLSELDHKQQVTLLQCALEARNQAYAPYSKFRVGACLLTDDGEFITGCNVENASYGAGICAERTALVKAISDGHQKFKAIAVASDIDGPCSPCGICRQFMREFCDLEMPVLMVSSSWTPEIPAGVKVVTRSLGELLPMSFGPDDLPK